MKYHYESNNFFNFNEMHLIKVILVILVISQTLAKKNKKVKEKERQLYDYLLEDDGHLVEPYLGGYNSDDAKMLIVRFKPMQEISESINPRWSAHSFK